MPVLTPSSVEYISHGVNQTRRAGIRLGTLIQAGDVIGLVGDLGSGKTTLVQGIVAGWGSLDQATSPTFVLVNVYSRPDGQHLYHLDAYRLSGAAEAEDLDLDMMLESGPLIVEWADRIEAALPADRLWITLKAVDIDQRDLLLTAQGEHYLKILRGFREQSYGVQ